jgi:murein DD-endopeptidase MepM/ murein hydrolase activator NlpD
MQKFQPVASIPADSSEMSAKPTDTEMRDAPKNQGTSCKSAAMLGIALSVGATGAFWGVSAKSVAANTVYPQYSAANFQEASNKKRVSLGTPLLENKGETGDRVWRVTRDRKVKSNSLSVYQPSNRSVKSNSKPSFFVSANETTEPTLVENREKKISLSSSENSDSERQEFDTTSTNERYNLSQSQTEFESITAKIAKEKSFLRKINDTPLDKLKDNLSKLRLQYDRKNIASAIITAEVNNTEIQQPTVIAREIPLAEIEPENIDRQSNENKDNSKSEIVTEDKTALTTTTNETVDNEQPIIIPVPAPEIGNNTSSDTNTDSSDSLATPLTTDATTASNTPKNNSNNEVHQVRVGDTLSSIARQYGLSRDELMAANGIDDPNAISIGQSLVIPVKSIETTKSNALTNTNVNRPTQLLVNNTVENEDNNTGTIANTSENNIRENNGSNAVLSLTQNNTATNLAENNSYLQKLTSDIQKIRQDDRAENENNDTPVALTNQEPIEIEVPPAENSTETDVEDLSAGDSKNRDEENQIATNSGDGSQYNRSLDTPIGTQVEPDLPPLSGPEEYLPDSQTSQGFIWPAKGVLTSGYGRRWGRMHKGIDIGAPIGTPIVAVANGEVISAGWNSGGFGNLVKIEHPDGTITLYAHNNRILVRKGQVVQQGEQISELGNTGRSTGPHLHFEIHPNGKNAVNPMALLPKQKK